jgi:hypothetical protein
MEKGEDEDGWLVVGGRKGTPNTSPIDGAIRQLAEEFRLLNFQ